MKIKILFALILALVLLAGCSQPGETGKDAATAGDVETTNDETQSTEPAVAEPEDNDEYEEGAEEIDDEPVTVDAEIKHEPNPDDPGVDRGVWEHTVYTVENGDIVYDFGDFIVTLPADWAGKFRTEIYEYGDRMSMTFYQTLSEDLYMDKYGFGGGKLFSVNYSADDDYLQFPDFSVIGTSEDSRTYYFAFPTDVQAFYEDETALAEYNEMTAGYDYIIANSHMTDAVG